MTDDIMFAHSDDPHFIERSTWLRAAVLGANDGIVSVSALIIGVAAADSDPTTVGIAGVAGLVAGAMSMAAGEYVSVSSQSDTEKADIERERQALKEHPYEELRELAAIYQARGLSEATALKAAQELGEKDALAAHIRDELGLSDIHSANPLQAAFTSAITFSVAAAAPVLAVFLAAETLIIETVLIVTLFALAILGGIGAKVGGAPLLPAIFRVTLWGIIAMAVTFGVGSLFGVNLN